MPKMQSLHQPVFIIGNPRSGTTLFRLILNSHPEISIPPESHFFLWLHNNYANWSPKEGVDKYLNDLFQSTKFETWEIKRIELRDFLLDYSPIDYATLNSLVYKFYGLKTGKDALYWGDKNKLWKEKLKDILMVYPKAKFLHLVRDGRDVACSFIALSAKKMTSKYAPKLPNTIPEIAERWKNNIQYLQAFGSTLSKNQFLTVTYEELLRNQPETIKGVCDFLQISYPQGGLSHLRMDGQPPEEPQEFLQWKEKIVSKIDLTNIGKYKKTLSEDEISIFNLICGKELTSYNYL